MTPRQQIENLIGFIDQSPSPWHAVSSAEAILDRLQFKKLDETEKWQLDRGGRYYVVRDGSSIIAFIMGRKKLVETGYRIVGAHTDSPGLRIKPNPLNSKDTLLRLNVEIYGSPILATFADRDLSLAGRVCFKDAENQIQTQLIQFDQPLLRLPNLAIHLNRSVNEEGLKLHKHAELPLTLSALTQDQLPPDYFSALLQKALEIDFAQILSWDLAVYDTQKGVIWGAENEFYSDSQLDNLASCHAALQALSDKAVLDTQNTVICALFDHEEVGSESKQGADGSFLPVVLQRLTLSCQADAQDFSRIIAKSFLISADMAHAYHPNYPNFYDHDHKLLLNKGPAIKINSNQRYSSESLSEAMFIDWCQQAGVPYQYYSHRGDLPCGSTIGPITSAKLGIRSVDVGNPMWSMHSIRESAGILDHDYLIRVLRQFFLS